MMTYDSIVAVVVIVFSFVFESDPSMLAVALDAVLRARLYYQDNAIVVVLLRIIISYTSVLEVLFCCYVHDGREAAKVGDTHRRPSIVSLTSFCCGCCWSRRSFGVVFYCAFVVFVTK